MGTDGHSLLLTDGRPAAESASVLALDAALTACVPPEDRDRAQHLLTGPLATVPAGDIDDRTRRIARRPMTALYVARGVLVREVSVREVGVPEVLGAGEFLMPALLRAASPGVRVGFRVLEPLTLVLLGRGLTQAAARWPALAVELDDRIAARHDRAMLLAAVGHLPRVEERCLGVLWFLAQHWGRVVADGTLVPFPLTHATLGHFTGARRPTVTLAVQKLADAGLVQRLADGAWLLPAGSAEASVALLGAGTPLAELVVRARTSRRAAGRLVREAEALKQHGADRAEESAALRNQAAQIVRHRGARDDDGGPPQG